MDVLQHTEVSFLLLFDQTDKKNTVRLPILGP